MKTLAIVLLVLTTAGCATARRPQWRVRPMSPATRAEIDATAREMREAAAGIVFYPKPAAPIPRGISP